DGQGAARRQRRAKNDSAGARGPGTVASTRESHPERWHSPEQHQQQGSRYRVLERSGRVEDGDGPLAGNARRAMSEMRGFCRVAFSERKATQFLKGNDGGRLYVVLVNGNAGVGHFFQCRKTC